MIEQEKLAKEINSKGIQVWNFRQGYYNNYVYSEKQR